jgi:hypothetical protein
VLHEQDLLHLSEEQVVLYHTYIRYKTQKWYSNSKYSKQINTITLSYITTLQTLVVPPCIYFPTAFAMPIPQKRKSKNQ